MAISPVAVLSRAQVEAFYRDGFLILDNVLDGDTITLLRASLGRLLVRAQAEADHNPDFQVEKGTKFHSVRKINNYIRYGEEWWELVRHPMIVQAVRDLMGDPVLLHHTKLMMKPPFEGSAKEWHQDLDSYVDAEEKRGLIPLGAAVHPEDAPAIAVQYYLDDSTETNGCLEFVPGSHRWGLLERDRVNESAERSQVVKAPAKAGSAALFHCLTLHYSSPNRSPQPRRGPIVQYYVPTGTVRFRPSEAEGRDLRLA